jgi:hypothetical protein
MKQLEHEADHFHVILRLRMLARRVPLDEAIEILLQCILYKDFSVEFYHNKIGIYMRMMLFE